MCGFAGFIYLTSLPDPPDRRMAMLQAMATQLSRRGPDDETFYDTADISFVFRRLSIVDLPGGRQPIWNEDHSLCVLVNGEIYNHLELRSQLDQHHRFRTRSDSEVVLHLYEECGAKALSALNGMFTIALWDQRRRKLFLARDRLGIKPLYYCHTQDLFLFGSELKSLIVHPACPTELDWPSLTFVPSPLVPRNPRPLAGLPTFLKEVRFLPGGHFMEIEGGSVSEPREYWSVAHAIGNPKYSYLKTAQEFVEAYGSLLRDSIKKRLMSDVPLGCFLSGGVDSAAVALMAKEEIGCLHAFHICEQAIYKSGDTKSAEDLCERFGLLFHPVFFDDERMVSQINYDLAAFEYFVWAMEMPQYQFEWILKHELHRYAKTLLPDLKVILLGQGGDEFAGGYSAMRPASWRTWYQFCSVLKDKRLYFRVESSHLPTEWYRLFADGFLSAPDEDWSVFGFEQMCSSQSLQIYNLWHEDRTSSAQGVEARVPFLDHRLIELLCSVPEPLHQELFWNKKIIRRAAEQWLPREVAHRRKVPLYTEDSEIIDSVNYKILKAVFPDFCSEYLSKGEGPFSESALREVLRRSGPEGDRRNWMNLLLHVMAISVFHRMCSRRGKGFPGRCLDTPSPLHEVREIGPELWSSAE
ncbi:MAG: asparagine synthase (glutamine-hydrolyzing) [Thermodesulfobacteriota bacterium]|nr:asparagine synthase (glutamine-hydrolyzing) [Thermodesulfobacteriota bacterium]